MALTMGQIKGQMVLDVKQALAAYTEVRLAHLSTVTALSTGGAALQMAGAGLAAVGIGIGAGIMTAVNAAAEFERKLDYFSAVSASTQAEYDAIREKALQLGQDTIYSAGEIADSFVELGKAGVGASDIINGIGAAVANLGAAADIPLDTASNILMSAVQTFGLSADQAVGVADKLAGAANASIVDVQDLGTSLKYAGGVAASLSIPFEDVNTALALLGTYGLKGSTAGTSLRQILVSLGGATKKATRELTDLGIITEDGTNKFFNADGSAKSLAEIFQILQEATAGMGDEQRLAALKTIFQNRALASAIALTKEGTAGFATMSAEIEKTTAMDVASKRLDNLSGDIEILRGNLETLAITSGSSLQDFARGIVQGLTQVVQWFTNLSDSTQSTILKIAAVSAVVLTLVGAFGVFAGSVLQIVGLIIRMRDAWVLLKTSQLAVTVSTWAMNTALWANPIVWIIAAVIALIAVFVLLWKNNEGFRNFFISMWDGIKTATAAVIDWFKSLPAWFSSVWNSIKDTASSVWNGITNFFKTWGTTILAIITGPIGMLVLLFSRYWEQIKNGVVTVWNSIVSFFTELPGRIGSWLAQLPGLIGYWIGFALGFLLRLWIDGWLLVINATINFVTSVVTFFQELPGKIVAFVTDLWNGVVNLWNSLYDTVTTTAQQLVQNTITFFQELPGKVAQFFSDLYNQVRSWMIQAAVWAILKAQELVTGVINFFQQLPGRVAQFLGDVVSWVQTKMGEAKDRALEIAGNIYNGVSDAISKLPELAKGIFDNVVGAIKGMVRKAFDAVKDFASGMWEGFKDGLGIHSPSYIERAMWQITGVLDDETTRMQSQVRTIQDLGNRIVESGSTVSEGWNNNLDAGLTSMQNQVAAALAYQDQLNSLTTSATVGMTTAAQQAAAGSTVTNINNTELNVEWVAAPDSEISSRQQLMNMLGKSKTTLETSGSN